MKTRQKKSNLVWYVVLHILLLIYSFSGVFSKIASTESPFSPKFILCYGAIITILGIYAILWQQVLKHFDLTTAFCNKAISVLWGMVLGRLVFNEVIKWNMIVGAVIVVIGVVLVVSDE